jgi:DNA repair protein RecO (recombination protein O)
MDERAHGIILRTRPLTETSLIIHWLTSDLGRVATVAKGARRPKSPLRGKLDLFYEADFSFARSRRSELHNLREVGLRDPHSALRREMKWLQQASYCAALIEQTTETETPLREVFGLMRDFLSHLTRQPAQPRNLFAFELKLLDELGLKPDFTASHLTPGAQKLVQALLECEWPAIAELAPTAPSAREVNHFLLRFLEHQLGKIPKGRTLC